MLFRRVPAPSLPLCQARPGPPRRARRLARLRSCCVSSLLPPCSPPLPCRWCVPGAPRGFVPVLAGWGAREGEGRGRDGRGGGFTGNQLPQWVRIVLQRIEDHSGQALSGHEQPLLVPLCPCNIRKSPKHGPGAPTVTRFITAPLPHKEAQDINEGAVLLPTALRPYPTAQNNSCPRAGPATQPPHHTPPVSRLP